MASDIDDAQAVQIPDDLLVLLMADEPLYSAPVPVRALPADPPSVAERVVSSAADFAAEFQQRFRGREPVILRGLAAPWPAIAQWPDPEFFSARLGDQDVDVLTTKGPCSRRFLKAECNVERRPFSEVVREVFACSGQADQRYQDSLAQLDVTLLASSEGAAAGIDSLCLSPTGGPPRRLYARAPLAGGLAADVDLADLAALLPGSQPPGPALSCCADANVILAELTSLLSGSLSQGPPLSSGLPADLILADLAAMLPGNQSQGPLLSSGCAGDIILPDTASSLPGNQPPASPLSSGLAADIVFADHSSLLPSSQPIGPQLSSCGPAQDYLADMAAMLLCNQSPGSPRSCGSATLVLADLAAMFPGTLHQGMPPSSGSAADIVLSDLAALLPSPLLEPPLPSGLPADTVLANLSPVLRSNQTPGSPRSSGLAADTVFGNLASLMPNGVHPASPRPGGRVLERVLEWGWVGEVSSFSALGNGDGGGEVGPSNVREECWGGSDASGANMDGEGGGVGAGLGAGEGGVAVSPYSREECRGEYDEGCASMGGVVGGEGAGEAGLGGGIVSPHSREKCPGGDDASGESINGGCGGEGVGEGDGGGGAGSPLLIGEECRGDNDEGCASVNCEASGEEMTRAPCRDLQPADCDAARNPERSETDDSDATTTLPPAPSPQVEADGLADAASAVPVLQLQLSSCGARVSSDAPAPPASAAPEFKLANCGVWVGCAGNLTPLHYDLCHGFLVGVIGTKVVSCFGGAAYSDLDEVDYSRCMYRRDDAPELSNVDLDAWRCGEGVAAGDAERRLHPRFGRAVHRVVELRPGDVLYTPPFCWHHVETTADGPAVSVLVPFDQTQEEATATLLAAHYA